MPDPDACPLCERKIPHSHDEPTRSRANTRPLDRAELDKLVEETRRP